MTSDSHEPGAVSRRALLGGAAGISALGALGLDLALATPAFAAPSFILPTATSAFIDDFWEHLARDPPSGRPGTDYSALRDHPVWAAAAGTVVTVKNTLSGGDGRMVVIDHGGSWKTYYLHLSRIDVAVDQVLNQGSQIGLVGGSANDSETGWPAHLHISLSSPTPKSGIYDDFQIYVGGAGTPIPGKEDELRIVNYSNVDYLVGKDYIYKSPNQITTNMMKALWGPDSKPSTSQGELQLVCRPLGIPDSTFGTLQPGQAWELRTGILHPLITVTVTHGPMLDPPRGDLSALSL